MEALNRYYETFRKDITTLEFFFVNKLHRLTEQTVRAMINNQAAAIGYEKHITQYMFRHSFATLLEEDVGIRYIKNSRSQLNFHNADLHARFNGKAEANSLGQAPEDKIII